MHGGMIDYWHAHRWLFKTGRWTWMAWPFLCSLCVLPVYAWAVWRSSDAMTHTLLDLWGMASGLYWLLWPIMLLISLLFGYMLLKNILMLLCLPLNMKLADAVIAEHDAQLPVPHNTHWRGALGRSLRVALLSILLSLLGTVLLLLLGLIPLVGPVITLTLGIMLQSFLAAWGCFDPVYERVNVGPWASFKHSLRHAPVLISSGLPSVLLFQIPIIGWTLAPSYGTVAGAMTALRFYTHPAVTQTP